MDSVTTLGHHMIERREELGLSQSAAARATKIGYGTQISRSTWVKWEQDIAIPERFNYVRIEKVLDWTPASVKAILEGGEPTPLRREHAPPEIPPIPPGMAVDPERWAAWEPTERQLLIDVYNAAEERRKANEMRARIEHGKRAIGAQKDRDRPNAS